ncbi:MAG: PstS family phosphate ABC transporter substrate-binding protein [Steroidobacteraceae bacterium]
MKTRLLGIGLLAGVAALAAAPRAALAEGTVKIDGSSTVFPISEAVAEEFQIQKRGKVRVTVGISGTGGGFKKFCRGETDVSDASRPILKAEMDVCAKAGIKYIELPIAYDALTVVVNPQATWIDQVTVAELKKMWDPTSQGVVSKWSQVNGKWPNAPLKLFGPGSDSGTFDYFTEAVNGKAKSSRGDFTASEDDNVLVQGIEADRNALAYFGYAYYAANAGKMKALKVVNAQGKAVGPSEAAVLDGSYNPFSRPLFIYVNAASAAKPEVREFIDFYLTQGAGYVKEVKYVPLAPEAYRTALGHFHGGKLGSVFGGVPEVGLRVEELLKREGKL